MNKPLSVEKADLSGELTSALNASRAPAWVKLEVVESLQRQLTKLAQEEVRRDRRAWEQALRQEEQRKREEGNGAENRT